jgi:anthranilate phosphoribosyltransferase
MRALARKPRLPAGLRAVDIVGTGGDKSGSINLSTGAALLVAACGVPVVKHGNRAVSSRAGSADVLEALGVVIAMDEQRAGDCLAATGFTFLFAPHYHPAMKSIAPVRAALGVRTVFNVLGPLSNPAEPPFLVVGAFDLSTAELVAQALSGMNIERALVIHGAAGWDEPTPVGPFELFDVRAGAVRRERRDPADYGLSPCTLGDLAGGDAAHNARVLQRTLTGGERGAARDALLLGAALALEATGLETAPRLAVARAAQAIDSGAAAGLLEKLVRFHATDTARGDAA